MEFLRDLRFGLRTLLKNPTSSVVCVLTLALGIGANTAIFSVIDAVALRPLPYPESERLVQLRLTFRDYPGQASTFLSGPVYLALRERISGFQSLAALYTYSAEGFDLSLDGRSQRISRLKVSSDYFDVLGIQPQMGRGFTREEELLPGEPDLNRSASYDPANPLAVLSYGLWQELLGGDTEVLGNTILLSGVAYSVIGVMPPGFQDPLAGKVDVWVPHNLSPGGYNNNGNQYLSVLGRLSPTSSQSALQEQLKSSLQGLLAENLIREGEGLRIDSLQELLVGDLDSTLYILLGAVGILLLIACVNVANLQLSHFASRSRELAVRAAIGGSPSRLTRQLLTENLLLVFLGGAAGVLMAIVGVRTLLAVAPASIQQLATVRISGTVLLFTTAIALATGLLFGLAPAWRSSQVDIEQILRQSTRGSTKGNRWMSRLLVIGQISFSLVLLLASALLLISFRGLTQREKEVRTERIYTYHVDLSGPRYEQAEARVQFFRQLHDSVRAIPGVQSAGAVSKLPLSGGYHSWGFRIPGRNPDEESAGGAAQIRVTDGDYFGSLEIPLLRGRLFDSSDRPDSRPVILVNRTLAEHYFAEEEVLGKALDAAGGERTVVGIVEDVRHSHLLPSVPKIYLPHGQFASNRKWKLSQVVATETERPDLFSLIRRRVAAIDADLAIFGEATFRDVLSEGISQQRFATTLMTLFAAMALLLSIVGIHGVLTQIFSARGKEFAIRKALGAGSSQMLRIVFREAVLVALAGSLIGLSGGFLATRWMGAMLVDVSPTEPRIFLAVVSFLFLVALLVAAVPARRLLGLRPVDVLRNE